MEKIPWSQRWSPCLVKSYFPGNLLKKCIISGIFIELGFLHVLMFRPAPGDSNATVSALKYHILLHSLLVEVIFTSTS